LAVALRRCSQAFEQSIGRTAHMQDHRQPMLTRQLELLKIEVLLAFPQRVLAKFWHKEIQSDFAHRHQMRVASVRAQSSVQTLQIIILRPPHVQGMNAQGVTVAHLVRQPPHRIKIAHLHSGENAMSHTFDRCIRTYFNGLCSKLCGIKVAVGVDPERHTPIMPECGPRRFGRHPCLHSTR
jgi:hypothetical protein